MLLVGIASTKRNTGSFSARADLGLQFVDNRWGVVTTKRSLSRSVLSPGLANSTRHRSQQFFR